MLSLQKILVPTDFSECANDALGLAQEIAAKWGGSITLLHVYQLPTYPLATGTFVGGPQVSAEIVKDIVAALDRTKQEALASMGAVPVTTRIAEGVPYLEIARLAREDRFDLIVIGTHGRTGIRHLLLGSVAERVVRTAGCPVLTVRGGGTQPEATAAT